MLVVLSKKCYTGLEVLGMEKKKGINLLSIVIAAVIVVIVAAGGLFFYHQSYVVNYQVEQELNMDAVSLDGFDGYCSAGDYHAALIKNGEEYAQCFSGEQTAVDGFDLSILDENNLIVVNYAGHSMTGDRLVIEKVNKNKQGVHLYVQDVPCIDEGCFTPTTNTVVLSVDKDQADTLQLYEYYGELENKRALGERVFDALPLKDNPKLKLAIIIALSLLLVMIVINVLNMLRALRRNKVKRKNVTLVLLVIQVILAIAIVVLVRPHLMEYLQSINQLIVEAINN